MNALAYGINKYIHNKEDNSFDVKIIKILAIIYNEIDLVNPILLNDYKLLDKNLLKYLKNENELTKFKTSFNNYMINNDINAFLTLYKIIIDMIAMKYKDSFITEDEVKMYESYFFEGKSVSSLKEYWDKTLYRINHKITLEKINENIYNPYIYYLQGKNLADLKELSNDELVSLNEEILKKYNLNLDDKNLKEKIDKIVYKALHPMEFSTGNGFVDIIMIISFVSTVVMAGMVIAILILKR